MIWAIVYFGLTLGGPASATIGMRVMDLEMRTWYGAPAYFVLGAVHAVVFWLSVSALSPFILLVAFFNERRRLLHDIVLGTVVINNAGARPRCAGLTPPLERRSDRPFDGQGAARDAIRGFEVRRNGGQAFK